MNKTSGEAEAFLQTFVNQAELDGNYRVLFFAPFTSLHVFKGVAGTLQAEYGAQNMYPEAKGAFTGEISPAMIQDLGCTWVLVGHSERRHVLKEDDAFLRRKVDCALEAGLKVMLCVGELLDERKAGQEKNVCRRQLEAALKGLTAEQMKSVAVAYEPVWAIGTGENASLEQAREMCAYCREQVAELQGRAVAEACWVLYGGSVKPGNIGEYMGNDDIDGALVGGASLKPDSFYEIMQKGLGR